MEKRQFKPGNMLYPVPAVLVTAADREGNSNIFTVAWREPSAQTRRCCRSAFGRNATLTI